MSQLDTIKDCAKKIAGAAKMGHYFYETNIDPDTLGRHERLLSELEATETAARILVMGRRLPQICESPMGGWIIKH
jgi:methyl coenzyme M reductase subunit D